MTVHRAPIKEGDTVYVMNRKVRGKVLGRLKYLVLLEARGNASVDQGAPRSIQIDPPEAGEILGV